MKLKNLAALIFRIMGAFFTLCGVTNMIALFAARNSDAFISEGLGLLIPGLCFLYFSKKLANLFCRGLDDDQL